MCLLFLNYHLFILICFVWVFWKYELRGRSMLLLLLEYVTYLIFGDVCSHEWS